MINYKLWYTSDNKLLSVGIWYEAIVTILFAKF